jgi:hypothetical protein
MSDPSTGGQSASAEARRRAEEAGEAVRDRADRVMEQGREQTRSLLQDQKRRAADRLGGVAEGLHEAAHDLEEHDLGFAARYADRAAARVEGWARGIRERDIDDVLSEAEDYARRQPELFVGGAFLAGFVLARLAKSSSDRRRSREAELAATSGGGAYGIGRGRHSAYEEDLDEDDVDEIARGREASGYGGGGYPGGYGAGGGAAAGLHGTGIAGVQGAASQTEPARPGAAPAAGRSTTLSDANERFSGTNTMTGGAVGPTGSAAASGAPAGGGPGATATRTSSVGAGPGGTGPSGQSTRREATPAGAAPPSTSAATPAAPGPGTARAGSGATETGGTGNPLGASGHTPEGGASAAADKQRKEGGAPTPPPGRKG